jgi:hypothetical protein
VDSSRFDHNARRQLTLIKIISVLTASIFFVGAGGLYLWRLHYFPRVIATIESIEERMVPIPRNSQMLVTFAVLSFTRVSSAGASVKCAHPFEIGLPSDGFKVGDKLEIVPDSGGCSRIDIIGRAKSAP